MTPDAMAQLIDAHVSAEMTGDLDAAVAVYTDDIEHDVVGAPDGPTRGVDAARSRYEQLMASDMHVEEFVPTRTYYSHDACVIEHLWTGTVSGQFAGLQGHGRRISFRMLHIFEFRDGKISRENVWIDTASITAQLETPMAAAPCG